MVNLKRKLEINDIVIKVAFPINNSTFNILWENNISLELPNGWELTELNSSGAKYMAIFNVDEIPHKNDFTYVDSLLRRLQ